MGTDRRGPDRTAGGTRRTSPGAGQAAARGGPDAGARESDPERRRRRAQFLRDLKEARELRERVRPRRARAARMRQAMRMRTFRW
ncbi:hypothetical protein RKE29_07365 [Streptomyces sp. B1866]|uniref:hypothetical protein n=1 Tax=Streptomyces sp. B1866 TaxID=3075431 RepID=UPI00289030E0|nr:hypothetical protein [Streptomyces sp. B1866]MDT3396461.1 hypothetical protein [Streptomyces sp. B1866]